MKNVARRNRHRVWLLMGLGLTLMACSQPERKNAEAEHNAEAHDHAEDPSHAIAVEAHSDQASSPHARSAESHIHGGAVLSIVSENDAILVELETPLFNLLGFEYAPNTPEERARVSEVETRLAQPQSLIQFNAAAKCTFEPPKIKPSLFGTEDDHMEHDDDHEDDDHDDHEDEADAHKDIVLSYALRCDAINKLKNVQVEFFEHFPNFTELELVYLGPTRQMSAELSRSRPSADLTR